MNGASSAPDNARRVLMSACVDGELSPDEMRLVLQSYTENGDVRVDWQTYNLIGEVLRGTSGPALPARCSQDFVAALDRRLEQEVALPSPVEVTVHTPLRAAAANDSTFFWKAAAGFASVVAVLAVSWNMMSPVNAPVTLGPQLAQQTEGGVGALPATVVVQTPQGQVLRDVRLEELLAEHRQFGGMSALQMPAGFLRNATYDAAPAR
jgi:sigma-E factor negative regulatory protein RseA